jgi:hypothetical protein
LDYPIIELEFNICQLKHTIHCEAVDLVSREKERKLIPLF